MVKAVILGAAGGIGQSLSLLLKTNPLITELGLYDIKGVQGVAADLSHISTPAKVVGFGPEDDGLHKVLANTDVVIILAGVALVKPTHPSEDVMAHPSVSAPKVDFRDQLFNINAGILRDLATGIATISPKAFILIISNPVNALVPLVSEVFKKHGVYDPKRLFGVTTLDVERASTFVAEAIGTPAEAPNVVVPVIGGHSGTTIVPLLSQSSHPLPSNFAGYDELVHRIQYGGAEVVKAKEGKGSATLSTAHAVYELALKVVKANKGESSYITPSYVDLTADPEGGAELKKELGQEDLAFFSSRVQLGHGGVNKIYGIGTISDAESAMVKAVIPQLVGSISKGIGFMASS